MRQAVDDLGPGVRRLRPDDHFMVLTETAATPMHVGALLLLDVTDSDRPGLFECVREHILARLPATPLLAALHAAPDGYDSDVWVDVAACDPARHFNQVSAPLDRDGLHGFIADAVMQRLDLRLPPFSIHVFDALSMPGAALYLKVHHALVDGIGFQTIIALLGDAAAVPPPHAAGHLPDPGFWHDVATARFAASAGQRAERQFAVRAVLDTLKSGVVPPRTPTPVLKLSAPTSTRRAYTVRSFAFDRFRNCAKALSATINDLLLALAGTAVRETLLALDDLPVTPITVNSARSTRDVVRHGQFGNRIVAIHPHLATDLPDPMARLRAIQASMIAERARTHLDEALLDAPEVPFGARDRRAKFAARTAGGGTVLPGNVTVSNVPGPDSEQYMAGYRIRANYPAPLLGAGRFINFTMRRNAGRFDLGVMVDPDKIADVEALADRLVAALVLYEGLAA